MVFPHPYFLLTSICIATGHFAWVVFKVSQAIWYQRVSLKLNHLISFTYFSLPHLWRAYRFQRWSQVEKTHGCAWTKENIYPALLLPHVEIICVVYDLRDTKDISSGHISLDWQCEFCRTSDWQRWFGGFSWASQFNHKGKIVKQWWFLSHYYSNRRQKIVQCQ